ncbi:MAG TPA: hypothetical protein VMP13_08365, partial [Acidimicrobiia bacterium]|nr:hypothetical protein [Acidimicrobiia bacterium]
MLTTPMRRIGVAWFVAFCVSAGLVFGEFVNQINPIRYLLRPVVLVLGLSLLVALVAVLFDRWAPMVAGLGAAGIVRPSLVVFWLVVVSAVVVGYQVFFKP